MPAISPVFPSPLRAISTATEGPLLVAPEEVVVAQPVTVEQHLSLIQRAERLLRNLPEEISPAGDHNASVSTQVGENFSAAESTSVLDGSRSVVCLAALSSCRQSLPMNLAGGGGGQQQAVPREQVFEQQAAPRAGRSCSAGPKTRYPSKNVAVASTSSGTALSDLSPRNLEGCFLVRPEQRRPHGLLEQRPHDQRDRPEQKMSTVATQTSGTRAVVSSSGVGGASAPERTSSQELPRARRRSFPQTLREVLHPPLPHGRRGLRVPLKIPAEFDVSSDVTTAVVSEFLEGLDRRNRVGRFRNHATEPEQLFGGATFLLPPGGQNELPPLAFMRSLSQRRLPLPTRVSTYFARKARDSLV